jgi:HPt (histidine-containing phosphotransfer) domain-containing protein
MLQVLKVLDDLKKIPVIVISANTDKRNVLAAVEAGAERVISKPLQKEIIIKYLKEILGEDVLTRSKKAVSLNQIDKNEIQANLVRVFLKSYPEKKAKMQTAIDSKNPVVLKSLVHELHGNGGMIGYPKLTELASNIEEKLDDSEIVWSYITLKCEQIFTIVNEIENLTIIQGK